MDWIPVVVIIHIISGYIALAAGFAAVISRKKKGKHSWFGNVFFLVWLFRCFRLLH